MKSRVRLAWTKKHLSAVKLRKEVKIFEPSGATENKIKVISSTCTSVTAYKRDN